MARLRSTGAWRRVLAGGASQPPAAQVGFKWLKENQKPFGSHSVGVRKTLWTGAPENSAPTVRKPGQRRNSGDAALHS